MIKVVKQIDKVSSYAGLTVEQLASAFALAWNAPNHPDVVRVDFGEDSDDQTDISMFHGIILFAPFDSECLMTGHYGGYDHDMVELADIESEIGTNADAIEIEKGYQSRLAYVISKALDKLLWGEWFDSDGLIWCEVTGCVADYINSLPDGK